MNKFFSKVVAFVREEEGLTMVEYAIGAAIIGGTALALFKSVGTNVEGLSASSNTSLEAAVTAANTAAGK